MVGLQWKIPLRLMIWEYSYLRKPPTLGWHETVEERDFEPKAPFHHNDAGHDTELSVSMLPVALNEKPRSYEEFLHMIERG